MKKHFSSFLLFFSVSLFLLLIFRNWFQPGFISAGDFWPISEENYASFSLIPYAWNYQLNGGVGGSVVHLLWTHFLFSVPVILWGKLLQLPYELVERLGFLFPLLIVAVISSYVFAKHFFKDNLLIFISMIIYLANIYIFMVIAGGQLPIAFAYFLAAPVLLSFIKLYDLKTLFFKQILICGLLLGALIGCDLRFAYITLIGVFVYVIYITALERKLYLKNIYSMLFSIFVAGLLHAFWILPLVLSGANPSRIMGEEFTGVSAVSYFSFAKLENTLGFLHPNWPENIFGKVSFMRPEFLIIPLFAFLSLLFLPQVEKKEKKVILFFSLLAVVGIFLAKGTNPPFEHLYYWMFSYIPGFYMFRDSMKFYLLIAISYAILIPFTLGMLSNALYIGKASKQGFILFVVIGFVCYWLFLLLPVLKGDVKGILQPTSIHEEYITLKNELMRDTTFSRTLWIPQRQRFVYFSDVHPAVDGHYFFPTTDSKKMIRMLSNPSFEKTLQSNSIMYVIVPIDANQEIFLDDRKYSDSLRKKVVSELDKVSYLTKRKSYKDLAVYEVKKTNDLFTAVSARGGSMPISYTKTSPVSYNVTISQGDKEIVFSQAFDKRWVLSYQNTEIYPKKSTTGFNLYTIKEKGVYTLTYHQQKPVFWGFIISAITFIGIVAFLSMKKV